MHECHLTPSPASLSEGLRTTCHSHSRLQEQRSYQSVESVMLLHKTASRGRLRLRDGPDNGLA
jgi:hypothetical protein